MDYYQYNDKRRDESKEGKRSAAPSAGEGNAAGTVADGNWPTLKQIRQHIRKIRNLSPDKS